MTQYRWRGAEARAAGPWREFLTLAKLDAAAGGGTGADEEIETLKDGHAWNPAEHRGEIRWNGERIDADALRMRREDINADKARELGWAFPAGGGETEQMDEWMNYL